MKRKNNINSWTFGIITNGKKLKQIEKILKSIRDQNIPNYEIIICGTYKAPIKKDTNYIPFNEKEDLGWTTKKKNLICEAAQYENMLIMHDRISLHMDWFKGMKRYGNDFDVLSCKVLYNGQRSYDWLTTAYPYEDIRSTWYLGGYLNYSDTDKWVYVDGGMIILKRSVWKQVKWDENLFWGQREDVKLSHDFIKAGFKIEFNPFATCETLSFNHPVSKLRFRGINKIIKYFGPIHLVVLKQTRFYLLQLIYKVLMNLTEVKDF